MSKAEDLLFAKHDKQGLKLYGKKRWDNANVGWGSSENYISSKVYGNPTVVLTSTLSRNKKTVYHAESEY